MITVTEYNYHRNGVGGVGMTALRFTDSDTPGHTFIGLVPDDLTLSFINVIDPDNFDLSWRGADWWGKALAAAAEWYLEIGWKPLDEEPTPATSWIRETGQMVERANGEARYWIDDYHTRNLTLEDWFAVVDEERGGAIAYFGRQDDAIAYLEDLEANE